MNSDNGVVIDAAAEHAVGALCPLDKLRLARHIFALSEAQLCDIGDWLGSASLRQATADNFCAFATRLRRIWHVEKSYEAFDRLGLLGTIEKISTAELHDLASCLSTELRRCVVARFEAFVARLRNAWPDTEQTQQGTS